MKAWPLLFVAWPAFSQAPAFPVCWPAFSNADYTSSVLIVAEGPTCRWARWYCWPIDKTKPTMRYTFAGTKAANPATTLLGRALTLENASDSAKPIDYLLMWKTYITAPIPASCLPEIP